MQVDLTKNNYCSLLISLALRTMILHQLDWYIESKTRITDLLNKNVI